MVGANNTRVKSVVLEAEYSEFPKYLEYKRTSVNLVGSGRAYVIELATKFDCTVKTVAVEGLVICLTIGTDNWVWTVKLIDAIPDVWIVDPFILIYIIPSVDI